MSRPNAVITLSEGLRTPVVIGGGARIAFIAGPCQMESRQHALETAHALKEIGERLNVGIIYKTSFDKANRTSASAARGIGLKDAMPIFAEIRETVGLPTLTDVHSEAQCGPVGEVVDVLQIPAFLSRQTDLLLAAAATGKAINIKKGQFLAPWDMKNVIAKVVGAGNPNVMACERGASFGYNTLVSDMRALPVLREIGCPVVFDATHSVQQPGGQGTSSGGQREFVPVLARAAASSSRRSSCCPAATNRVLTMVAAPTGLVMKSTTRSSAAIRSRNSAPAASSPVTAPRCATPPRAATLRATLPTPPGMAVVRRVRNTGIGASGEIRLTSP